MTSTTLDADVRAAAERLQQARRTGTPCAPVRDLLATAAEAYAVQDLLVDAAVAEGRVPSGRKVGLTNPAVQAQLGVDQPDSGALFADLEVPDGGTADMARFIAPRVEAEVAVVLGADLDAGPFTPEAVRAAVGRVAAALEVVDSRVAGWDIALVDTVADGASSGAYVLGASAPLGELDLREVVMDLDEDGRPASSGRGTDCLGDPLAALAWLARTEAARGRPLRAGEVVLTGALGPVVPVVAGARYTARVAPLGAVSVTFAHAPTAPAPSGGPR